MLPMITLIANIDREMPGYFPALSQPAIRDDFAILSAAAESARYRF